MTAAASGGSGTGGVSGNTFYGATAINVGAGGDQNNYFQLVIDDPVEAAARDLARTVLAQWREEARVRGLFDPVPIPVPWRAVRDPEFGDHPHLTGGSADGSGADLGAFARAFLALRQRRLVVLGEAGAGKTTLAVLLVIELLQMMGAGDAVPVLLPIASWRPGQEHLHTWLEQHLLRDYPHLTVEMARDLIRDRRIMPVLDGLDELSPDQAPVALQSLNDTLAAGGPLILTCRTSAYADAVRSASVLRSAAVVRADPLSAETAAEYLRSSATPQHSARWKPVLDELREHPHGALARCLSTPLMLWLARISYRAPDTCPAELARSSRFPGAAAIERHLLDAFVSAVYPDSPAPPPPRGRRPPREWRAGTAERWLATLARHLTDLRSEDFAWWELRRRSPHWHRWRPVLVVALMMLWTSFPVLGGDELAPIGEAGGPLVILYVGSLFLGALLRIPDGLTRGRVRFRPNLRMLVDHAANPMSLYMVLAAGLGTVVDAAPDSPAVQVLLFVVALATAVLTLLLYTWLMVMAGTRVDRDEAGSPHRSLAVSRRRALVAAAGLVVLLVPFITAPVLATTLADPSRPYSPAGYPLAPAFRLAALAVAFASLAALTQSSWADYLLARSILAARGLMPWRLGTFLADAHRRGVLRQAGSVYQFRHARLRDRLAERYGPSSGAAAAGPDVRSRPTSPTVGSGTTSGNHRGQDLLIEVDITPTEARSGTVKQMRFVADVRCATCGGSGTTAGDSCGECAGQGRVSARRTLSVRIPAGVRGGIRIRVAGEGGSDLHGGTPGDLYIELRERHQT
ncbi:NACHT domain-containing protein [Streptomyces sp. F-1]|uniref:NACHT domain-containing protein n=1 Tax=Streptomyces sp. F-1 TaxID=463642 RepID=UPI00086C0C0E|nr:NACHT domain-containing protein [Streptomyces sp. F-1]SFY52717.1 Chaperone protein DnaJ [Streptomyces sp. F-1]